MARRKTLPESLRAKHALAERLASLRLELFGERGGPEMARRLGIPVRTWYNYEGGVTVPAEVVLRIIDLTSAEPQWLLTGKGPKFRQSPFRDFDVSEKSPVVKVGDLLRTALQLLENGDVAEPGQPKAGEVPATQFELPQSSPARKELLEAQQENRCIRVQGDAMAPVVADGAAIAYSRQPEPAAHLDGKIVVAWIDEQPIVRWFQDCGQYGLLRAENPDTTPRQQLVDLRPGADAPRIRRVFWIDTPH
ncbi:LexA repressor [Aquisphaera giovannonii]|uniref:LexA repressor n=1 Tax=Aquisphaera giovannonii TaxID=406548 RepID=A0A5B9VWW2_9BACT|nr:S24 family peptidase [Aquisphaera giovannonii]QEH32758.1 LexA repressor [Aquisphaera giovannonii]